MRNYAWPKGNKNCSASIKSRINFLLITKQHHFSLDAVRQLDSRLSVKNKVATLVFHFYSYFCLQLSYSMTQYHKVLSERKHFSS